MGYFSEMSLDMQESRKPSAAPLTRERAFEEGESFDELPVPPADRQPVPPAEELAPQPAFEDDEDLSEVPEKQGQPDEAGTPAEETDDGDNADEGQAEPAKADTSNTDADEEKRRAEHEAAEAKRKAEWEAKQAEKKKALQEQMDRLAAMSDDEVVAASMQRVSGDVEKLTRRNMKECVSEYTLPHSEPYWHEFRRSIYDRTGEIRSYYWGMYCQRETRWIAGSPCYYAYYGDQSGRVYGKTLPSLEKKELRQTGLAEWIRSHPITDPEKYLAVWKRLPQMEQIWKAGLQRLTKECFHNCDNVRKLVLNPSEPGLIRALGLDASKFRRLRQMDGDTETLAWLQLEKRTGQRITDDMLRWSKKEQISAKDLVFIADRMSLVQIKNYLERQKEYFDGSCQQALTTWQDYLAMAERLHYDTSDEIVYRVRKLRQRHDELVLQSEAGSLEEQASKMAAKYPHVNAICVELQEKYAYSDDDYTVLAPQDIFEIIKEGRMLHHCVGNDGAGERYYDRMERRESFIMFLRRTEEPNDPYYTLEIEPDGTVRQKRTLFDRQYEDIEQATEFLIKWQKVIAARLTGRDLKLAERSRELRKEEFIQMRKDRVIIHTGHLAGRLLADVLLADLMENTEVMQPQALPAAA